MPNAFHIALSRVLTLESRDHVVRSVNKHAYQVQVLGSMMNLKTKPGLHQLIFSSVPTARLSNLATITT